MCLIFVGVAPVAADTAINAPASLHMRSRPDTTGTHWLPMRWGKRVAQAPNPDPPQPSGDQPAPPDGAPPVPAEPANPPAPEATPAPAPAPAVDQTPNLTDEELKKLSEQEAKEEVITITGSAIERRELITPAPVAILKKEQLDQAGLATVGDILQKLPAQSNAINAQANNGGDGATRVNIRGLGTNRTLTLLNGRRVVASGVGADASVDINTIPLAMIDRIEVLKDGASAVYGSDAIGGVVNIITRTDFNGTEVALYTGGSQKGDGMAFDGSFVTGLSGDKGHVLFSAGYQDQEPVFAGERGFSTIDKNFDFTTKEQSPGGSTSIPGGRLDTTRVKTANGQPFALCGTTTNDKGETVPVQYCTRDASSPNGWRPFVDPGDFYNYQPVNYLYTPSSRYNVAAIGSYDFTKRTHAFFEGTYMNRSSNQQLAPEPLVTNAAGVVISKDSVYNSLGVDIPVYRRRLVEFGPRASFQNVDSFRLVTGLNGKLDEDQMPALKNWKWEVSYNFGRTNAIQRNEGNLIVGRLANALGPSFIDPTTGVPTCGTPTAPIAGCVPMDILGGAVNDPFNSTNTTGSITNNSPAAIAYTTFTGVSTGFNQEHSALATAHGRVATTPWGGDIGLALGADYRLESGGFTPDPLTATGDTTGNAAQPTNGSYNVVEGFAEVTAVPIAHRGWAEWVELDLAARVFRYNTFGSGVTWKAGGLFRTLGGLSVRGTYSTAFRAPSIPELYTGSADNFPASEDPCDTTPPSAGQNTVKLPAGVAAHCMSEGVPADASFQTSQQRSIIGGNPKLKQETANVYTAGVVFTPPQAKGVALTLDYFHIKIKDALQALGATAILGNCYYFDLDEYCKAIHRTSDTHEIDYIEDPLRNVGGNTTSGLDFALSYDHQYPGIGRLHHAFEGTYLLQYDVEVDGRTIKGLGVYDLGVYPKLKANFATVWGDGPFGAGFNVRYIHSYRECPNNNCDVEAFREDLVGQERTVAANVTADVFGSYAMKSSAGTTTLAVGVNNVANTNPPLIYIGFAGDSDSNTYNYMGRFFYARLSQKF